MAPRRNRAASATPNQPVTGGRVLRSQKKKLPHIPGAGAGLSRTEKATLEALRNHIPVGKKSGTFEAQGPRWLVQVVVPAIRPQTQVVGTNQIDEDEEEQQESADLVPPAPLSTEMDDDNGPDLAIARRSSLDFGKSATLLHESRCPNIGIQAVTVPLFETLPREDYLTMDYNPEFPAPRGSDQIDTIRRQAEWATYDEHIREMRDTTLKLVAREDPTTLHDELVRLVDRGNEEYESYEELDELLGRRYAEMYAIKSINWNRYRRWRIEREKKRQRLLRACELDGRPRASGGIDEIAHGGQARIYKKKIRFRTEDLTVGDWRKQASDTHRTRRQDFAVKIGFKCENIRDAWWLEYLTKLSPPNIVNIFLHEDYHFLKEDDIWHGTITPLANCGDLIDLIERHSVLKPGTRYSDVTEYMDGADGSTPKTSLSEELIWTAMKQLLEALDFLHTGGEAHKHDPEPWNPIWHLDVKPDNILVHYDHKNETSRNKYNFILSDFGAAQWGMDRSDQFARAHHPKYPGTAGYMAPEFDEVLDDTDHSFMDDQDDLKHTVDERSDVWCLGAALQVAATGFGPRWEALEVSPLGDPTPNERDFTEFQRMRLQPLDPCAISFPLNHPICRNHLHRRKSPTRSTELGAQDRFEKRQYSKALNYHIFSLLDYVPTPGWTDTGFKRRPTATLALESVNAHLEEIRDYMNHNDLSDVDEGYDEDETPGFAAAARAIFNTAEDESDLNWLLTEHILRTRNQFGTAIEYIQKNRPDEISVIETLVHARDSVILPQHLQIPSFSDPSDQPVNDYNDLGPPPGSSPPYVGRYSPTSPQYSPLGAANVSDAHHENASVSPEPKLESKAEFEPDLESETELNPGLGDDDY